MYQGGGDLMASEKSMLKMISVYEKRRNLVFSEIAYKEGIAYQEELGDTKMNKNIESLIIKNVHGDGILKTGESLRAELNLIKDKNLLENEKSKIQSRMDGNIAKIRQKMRNSKSVNDLTSLECQKLMLEWVISIIGLSDFENEDDADDLLVAIEFCFNIKAYDLGLKLFNKLKLLYQKTNLSNIENHMNMYRLYVMSSTYVIFRLFLDENEEWKNVCNDIYSELLHLLNNFDNQKITDGYILWDCFFVMLSMKAMTNDNGKSIEEINFIFKNIERMKKVLGCDNRYGDSPFTDEEKGKQSFCYIPAFHPCVFKFSISRILLNLIHRKSIENKMSVDENGELKDVLLKEQKKIISFFADKAKTIVTEMERCRKDDLEMLENDDIFPMNPLDELEIKIFMTLIWS